MAVALVFVGRGLLPTDESHPEPEHDTGDGAERRPRRTRAARVTLMVLAVSGAFSITIELVSSDWAAFRLTEDFGAAAGFAGLGFVAFTAGMTMGRLGGDSLTLRVGGERMLRMAIVVSGIGLAAAAFTPNRWVVLAAYLVAGLGSSTLFPKLYDDAARFQRAARCGSCVVADRFELDGARDSDTGRRARRDLAVGR